MRSLAIAFTLAAGFCVGCGSHSGPPLARVSGQVTLNGLPAHGDIVFQPKSTGHGTGGRPSRASTNPDGTFTLYLTDNQPGALPGHHQVTVTASIPHATAEKTGKAPPAVAKVARFEREVVAGKTNVFPFVLN